MNEQALHMNRGMEFQNPFPNMEGPNLDHLVKKMNEMRTRAQEMGVSTNEKLANVRERLQIFSQIAQYKATETVHKVDQAIDYAIENPMDATKKIVKHGWIYGVGAGARIAINATGTALGYVAYPVTAIASGVSSIIVGGYKDWQRMQDKNGALELYRHYVGKSSLNKDTYNEDQKTGWWNGIKKFTGRHSMSVKEGYRRAYGAYTYKEKLQVMREDTSDTNLSNYNNRIAIATQNTQNINYRELHSLQSELRDKLNDATYAITVAMNNRDRKDGQEIVKKYFSILEQSAKYTGTNTAEFMRQVGNNKKDKLQSSAKKGIIAASMSRGTWSMVRFAIGGALVGKFASKPAEAHAAVQNNPLVPRDTIPVVKDNLKQSAGLSDHLQTPKPIQVMTEVVHEKVAAKTIPAVSEVQVPKVEIKPFEVTVLKNHGLFSSLEKSGWGETAAPGSGLRFMAEVAPQFKGHGLSEEQYEELMRAVYADKNISAEDLWKKYKWFDHSFIVQSGKFNINVPHDAATDNMVVSNYDIKLQNITKRPGEPKVLFSIVQQPNPQPPINPGTLTPGEPYNPVLTPGASINQAPASVPENNAALAQQWEIARQKQLLQTSTRPQFYTEPVTEAPQPAVPATEPLPVSGSPSILPDTNTIIPAGNQMIVTPGEANPVTIIPAGNEMIAPAITPTGEQIIIPQPIAAPETRRLIPEFNFEQKFTVQSGGKVLDITADNVKSWVHANVTEVPESLPWDQVTITEILGHKVVFVHSSRHHLMDLPGNPLREWAERGQTPFGYGEIQIHEHLNQAVNEGRTATFTGEDGQQQLFKLTSAQYMPYNEVIKNDMNSLNTYIENTAPNEVIVIFCGRSHAQAVQEGINLMSQATLSPDQHNALIALQSGSTSGDTYDNAIREMMKFLKKYDEDHSTKNFDHFMLLYSGAPFNNNLDELLKPENNPYMFSGARYILGLTPVGGE